MRLEYKSSNFRTIDDMIFLTDKFNNVIHAPIENITLKYLQEMPFYTHDLTEFNSSFFMHNNWLIYLCPCGCNQTGNFKSPTILKENPLTIKEQIDFDYKGSNVIFSVKEGKVIFDPQSGSHLSHLPKEFSETVH